MRWRFADPQGPAPWHGVLVQHDGRSTDWAVSPRPLDRTVNDGPPMGIRMEDIDLSDPAFWSRPWSDRNEAFDLMRAEEPIKFFEEPDLVVLHQGPGYWALTRHADVVEASRRADLFCSGRVDRTSATSPRSSRSSSGRSSNMDDPRHARQRKIVSRGFTPRVLDRLKDDVERAAVEIVDEIIDKGECDFVTDVAPCSRCASSSTCSASPAPRSSSSSTAPTSSSASATRSTCRTRTRWPCRLLSSRPAWS